MPMHIRGVFKGWGAGRGMPPTPPLTFPHFIDAPIDFPPPKPKILYETLPARNTVMKYDRGGNGEGVYKEPPARNTVMKYDRGGNGGGGIQQNPLQEIQSLNMKEGAMGGGGHTTEPPARNTVMIYDRGAMGGAYNRTS